MQLSREPQEMAFECRDPLTTLSGASPGDRRWTLERDAILASDRQILISDKHPRVRKKRPVSDHMGSRYHISLAKIDAISGKLLLKWRSFHDIDRVYPQIIIGRLRKRQLDRKAGHYGGQYKTRGLTHRSPCSNSDATSEFNVFPRPNNQFAVAQAGQRHSRKPM